MEKAAGVKVFSGMIQVLGKTRKIDFQEAKPKMKLALQGAEFQFVLACMCVFTLLWLSICIYVIVIKLCHVKYIILTPYGRTCQLVDN